MAAKKKAKKGKKTVKRKAAKKTAKRKVVAKKKAAPKRKAATRVKTKVKTKAKAIAKALAPSVERLKSGATEIGHGAMDAGRLLFGEAKEAGKEAQDKMKEITTDWINRVT